MVDELLTIKEAAEVIGIKPETLGRLAYTGRVPSIRREVPDRTQHMISRVEAERLRAQRTLPDGYVTVPEAAERLGIARQTMHSRNYSHLLEEVSQGGRKRLAVSAARLQQFIKERSHVPA